MRPEAGFRGEGVQFRVRHFFFLDVIPHAVKHHFDVIAILIADVDRLCEVRKVRTNSIFYFYFIFKIKRKNVGTNFTSDRKFKMRN